MADCFDRMVLELYPVIRLAEVISDILRLVCMHVCMYACVCVCVCVSVCVEGAWGGAVACPSWQHACHTLLVFVHLHLSRFAAPAWIASRDGCDHNADGSAQMCRLWRLVSVCCAASFHVSWLFAP